MLPCSSHLSHTESMTSNHRRCPPTASLRGLRIGFEHSDYLASQVAPGDSHLEAETRDCSGRRPIAKKQRCETATAERDRTGIWGKS
jgi:hypothetical protein